MRVSAVIWRHRFNLMPIKNNLGAIVMAFASCALVSCAVNPSPPRFYADLDTKEGHYSKWRVDSLESTTGCDFSLEIVSTYEHARWRPTATLAVRNEAEKKFVYVQFYPSTIESQLRARVRSSDSTDIREGEADLLIEVGKPVSISIRWDQGRVEFSADGKSIGKIAQSIAVTSFEASVSTAQMKLRDLSLRSRSTS
jgi:hypothetical protein